MSDYEWKLPDNWGELLKESDLYDTVWKAWKNKEITAEMLDKMDVPEFNESYKGWACVHGPVETHPIHNHTGKTIEELVFEINMIGGDIRIAVDQWWGVWSELNIANWQDESDPNWIELNFSIFVQSDNLHDGLEKVYDVCKSRWEFHKEKKWIW